MSSASRRHDRRANPTLHWTGTASSVLIELNSSGAVPASECQSVMPPRSFTVEPSGSSDHGPCECCGNNSRTVWGNIHAGQETVAVYYVQWTLNRVADHGANFDLILGPWGEGTSSADRCVVAVAYRLIDGKPQFMVIDADGRPVAKSGKLAEMVLRRDQVVGTPLAPDVFAILDAIWLDDGRIREL